MMIFRIARRRWWIVAVIGAIMVALAARLMSGGRMTQALVADAIALSAAAALVLLAARAPEMSARARTWHHLLAAALLLGALRAVLWVAGAKVATANTTILALAIAGALIRGIRRRRGAPR